MALLPRPRLAASAMALCLTAALLALLALPARGDAIEALGTVAISVRTSDTVFFGSHATFGSALPAQDRVHKNDALPVLYLTSLLTDPFGCTPLAALQNATNSSIALPTRGSFILLVDRGNCYYGDKAAIAMQLGAAALLVTDTMEQAFNRSQHPAANDPDAPRLEYDCSRGSAQAPSDPSVLLNASRADWRDRVSTRDCNSSAQCDSGMCIPTGVKRQVCCMWDVPDVMGFGVSNESISASDISIPVVRLKISDGDTLKSALGVRSQTRVLVTLATRDTPSLDPSQFILWMMAILTVIIGGYKGAAVERERALRKLSAAAIPAAGLDGDSPVAVCPRDQQPREEDDDDTSDDASRLPAQMQVTPSAPLSMASVSTLQEPGVLGDVVDDDTMEMTMWHAFGFVLFATIFLLILFYFNVLIVVVIFFALGSVTCTYYVLWNPMLSRIRALRGKPWKTRTFQGWLHQLAIETWTRANVLATICAVLCVLTWFVFRHAKRAWIAQDLFGMCLCVLFLRTIRLPNLKIATVMLVLVFFYDIFMVFVSPLIFNESVMIKAATGGAQRSGRGSGSAFCLRYPLSSSHHCVTEQMPILLRFPKVLDWRDGQSMLGLGDIVLPGLLLVFCARYDYATRGQLYGRVKPNWGQLKFTLQTDEPQDEHATVELSSQHAQSVPHRGLFGMLTWAYAIGLLAAIIGVCLMQQGQPALMYIVPATLGTLVLVAWRRGILMKLWDGPEEFHLAVSRQYQSTQRRLTHHDPAMLFGPTSSNGGDALIMTDTTPQAAYTHGETPKQAAQSTPVNIDVR